MILLLTYTPLENRAQNPKWRPLSFQEMSVYFQNARDRAERTKVAVWTHFPEIWDNSYFSNSGKSFLSPEIIEKLKKVIAHAAKDIKITNVQPAERNEGDYITSESRGGEPYRRPSYLPDFSFRKLAYAKSDLPVKMRIVKFRAPSGTSEALGLGATNIIPASKDDFLYFTQKEFDTAPKRDNVGE